jgi:mono/diheme cytochrome c family protein
VTRVRSRALLVGFISRLFGASLVVGMSVGLAVAADEGIGSPVSRLPDAERGRRVLAATGGCTCHTNYPGEGEDAPALAGGRAMETPFGVYYSTNITPDRETGIGDWSDEDFIRAMREGLSPEGEHYFPVFPYTSFAGLTEEDLVDLKAHLFSLPAVRRENRAPDAGIPFRWRWTIGGWKWVNFDPQSIEDDPAQSEAWNRGRYLVHAAAHCGECHTPRTLSGGLDTSMWLAGSREGPEGELAPNITPDSQTGIGGWSTPDLVWYLETGLKPDGDDTQGLMSEVIEHGYSHLPASELKAIAEYLRSLPAIENQVRGRP